MDVLASIHDANGNTFDLTSDTFKTINAEWRRGYSNGYARGTLVTTGVAVVSLAVVAGVAFGTRKFLESREAKKTSSTKE